MTAMVRLPRLLSLAIVATAGLVVVKASDVVRFWQQGVPASLASPGGLAATMLASAQAAAEPKPPSAPAPVPPGSAVPAPATAGATARPGAPSAGAKADAQAAVAGPNGAAAAPGATVPSSAGTAPLGATALPVSDSERALLLDLRQRRSELDTREATVAAREAALAAQEHRLAARLDQLSALQSKLEALESGRKDREDTNWRSLVKTYESMRPRDAAVIFNDLDMPVLLQVVDRMKETKAASILAAMQPEKARQLTTDLAQMRLKANSVAVEHAGG